MYLTSTITAAAVCALPVRFAWGAIRGYPEFRAEAVLVDRGLEETARRHVRRLGQLVKVRTITGALILRTTAHIVQLGNLHSCSSAPGWLSPMGSIQVDGDRSQVLVRIVTYIMHFVTSSPSPIHLATSNPNRLGTCLASATCRLDATGLCEFLVTGASSNQPESSVPSLPLSFADQGPWDSSSPRARGIGAGTLARAARFKFNDPSRRQDGDGAVTELGCQPPAIRLMAVPSDHAFFCSRLFKFKQWHHVGRAALCICAAEVAGSPRLGRHIVHNK